MSRARDTKLGYGAVRVGRQIMKHSDTTADKLYAIAADILDGDGDFRTSLRLLNEMNAANNHLGSLGGNLMDGNLSAAEASGTRMLDAEKRQS